MPEDAKEQSLFDKVGECLYRYRSTGAYYARIKSGGKEIRRSLKTNDRQVAKSNLSDLRAELGGVDLSVGRITLKELAERYHRVQGTHRRADEEKMAWRRGSAASGHQTV